MGSAYQDNEKKNKEQQKWYAGDTPNSREILNRVFEIGAQDAQKGYEMYNEYLRFQQDATSPIYNPYTRATNKAVSNLSAYGIDTRRIDDNFYKQNNFLLNYLVYNGTTNTPTKPGKNASTQQKAAYEYYQIWKDEEQTQKAETEWRALQQELNYWAQRSDLNYSDDEIIDRIDWKKYPTLAAMDNDKKFTPTSLNRAIGYSSDNMYGTLWAARNNGGTGDYLQNALASVGGHGNQWQYDEAKAKARTEDRYAAGMTLDDEGLYFGMLYFPEDWLEKNYDKYVTNGDEESRKKYNAVYKAEKDTKAAEEQLKNLNDQIKKWVGRDYSAEKIKNKLTELLESSDYNILAQMDESTKSGGDLVKLTRAVDFNLNRILAGIDDKVKARTLNKYFTEGIALATGAYNTLVPEQFRTVISNIANEGKTIFNEWMTEMEKADQEESQQDGAVAGEAASGTESAAGGTQPAAGASPVKEDTGYPNYNITIQDDEKLIDMMKYWSDKEYRDKVMSDPGYRERYDQQYGEGAFNRQIVPLQGYVQTTNDIAAGDKKFDDTVANLDGVLKENEDVRFTASSGMSDTAFNNQKKRRDSQVLSSLGNNSETGKRKANNEFISKSIGNIGILYQYEKQENRLAELNQQKAAIEEKYGLTATSAAKTPTDNFAVEYGGASYIVDNTNEAPVVMNEDTGEILSGKKLKEFLASKEYEDASRGSIVRDIEITAAKTQVTPEEEEAVRYLRQINHEIEVTEDYLFKNREQYEQDAKNYQETAEIWLDFYQSMVKAKQSTDEMNKAFVVMNALAGFTEYEARNWTTYNEEQKRIEAYNPMYAYSTRLASGESKDKVLADAKDEFDEIAEQIKDYKWLQSYIDRNGVELPDNVKENIQRRIDKLEWDRKAYDYFRVQYEDDFDAEAAAGKAYNAAVWDKSLAANEGQEFNPLTIEGTFNFDAGIDFDAFTEFISEDEKKTYYYLKQKDVEDAANGIESHRAEEFARYLTDDTYGAATTRMALKAKQEGEDLTSSGWLGFIAANAGAIMLSPWNAIMSLGYQVNRRITGKEINPYARELLSMQFRSGTREQSAKELTNAAKSLAGGNEKMESALNTVFNGLYEIVTNRLDSAANAAFFGGMFGNISNEILNEFIGAVPMGISAMTETMAEAKASGASDTQAYTLGMITFFAETATEAISLSNMKDAFYGAKETGEGIKAFIVNWLTEAGVSEAFGEGLTEIVEKVSDARILGELSQHEALVEQYRLNGVKNPEEAAMKDELAGVLHTILVSYLSPGLDVFSHLAGQTSHYRQTAKALQQMGYQDASMRNVRLEETAARREGRDVDYNNLGNNKKGKKTSGTQAQQTTTQSENKTSSVKPAAPSISEKGAETKQTVNESRMDDVPAKANAAPAQEQAQEKTQEQTAEEQYLTDFQMLQEVMGDESKVAKTETVAAVLDDGNTEDSADEARAAAAWLDVVTGPETDTPAEVQKLIKGAKDLKIDRGLLNQGIKYAALGGAESECRRVMQSSEYKNADMQTRARMIADAAKVDAQNQRVAETVQKNVYEDRVAREEAKILAGEAGEKVNTAAETVKQRRAEAQKRHTELATQQNVANLAYEQAAQATNAVAEAAGQGQDAMADALNEQSRANQNASKESIVTQEYEQSAKNADEAVETAKSDLDKAQQDTMNEVRPMAEEAVAQQNAQRAEAAEQQRIAEENARAEAQALQQQRDEETGKAEEDRQNAAIEQAVSETAQQEGMDADQAETLETRAKEKADAVKASKVDMTNMVNNTEGFLALEAFSRKLGLPIKLADLPEGVRGKYENGVVYLNQNRVKDGKMLVGQAMVEAALHEITHAMENVNVYGTYRKAVLNCLYGDANATYDNNASFRAAVDQKMEDYRAVDPDMTREKAEKEVIADFARQNLAQKDTVQRFMDAGLGGKMRNALHNVNQALKNYIKRMTGEERTAAENLRKAERAFQKALNEVAKTSTHPEGNQFSVMQFAQAAGMNVDENTLTLYDKNGNEIDGVNNKVTPEMIDGTPVGMLIDLAKEGAKAKNGNVKFEATISPETAQAQKQMFADLMNMVAQYKDSNLVWEIASSTMFSAMKSNSDPQYSTTVDFGTVCAKTQEIINVMSRVMLEKGRGLTRAEVLKVYNETANAGLTVPCPVCYVFSRWMGVPSLLNQMSQYQKKFVVTNDDGSINIKSTADEANKYIKYALNKYGDKEGIDDAKVSLTNRMKTQEKNRTSALAVINSETATSEEKAAAQTKHDKAIEMLDQLSNELGEVEAFNWVTQALCLQERKGRTVRNVLDKNGDYVIDPNFQMTPDEVLFDLRRTGDFAKYTKNWTYRNTRGAGMGKAIMPYSGETIGDIVYGTDRKAEIQNPFLTLLPTKAADGIKNAVNRARQQNLIGGQRLQSTSDFRPEWGLDYMMAFLELQAVGSKVQMYTKVAEAVDLLASMGGDINLSIMGQGSGYHEATAEEIALAKQDTDEGRSLASRMGTVGDTTYVLDFSDVTGMNYDTAKALKNKYSNVQQILVGMNDVHIQLALANPDIDFVIPWHSSGNSKDVLSSLISSVGEKLETSSDYTDTQSDAAREDQTTEQKALWDLRMKILQGKKINAEERNTIYNDPYLDSLYKRFNVEGTDPDCYKVKLGKDQANQIFPYEYWDKSLTKDQANQNGQNFLDYCEHFGIVPRFSGVVKKNDNGTFTVTGNFAGAVYDDQGNITGYDPGKMADGYWKVLIDRPMYDNDGNYRDQQVVDVTKAKVGKLENGKLTDSDMPLATSAMYGPNYSEQEKNAVDNSLAALDENPGMNGGQYSVFGDDLTAADRELMEESETDRLIDSMDEDYMAAVESGDMETAMELVEQAARMAMPRSKRTGQENNIYIKDGHDKQGNVVDFASMILDGKKHGETRTHKSLTRKWVGIAKDGEVIGRVRLGEPRLMTKYDANGEYTQEYKDSMIEGTEYDIEDGETKYYYPVEEVMDLRDNPRPIVRNGNYGQYQFKSNEAVTYDDNGNVIPLSERFNMNNSDYRYSIGGEQTEADMELARTDQALIDAGVLTEEELAQFNALSTQTGEGSRQRQFGHKTAQESDALHDDVKEYLYKHSDYTPDTNEGQINRATDWVRNMANANDPNGYHAAVDEVTSENFDYRSADGQARMLTVMAMAAQQGDHAAEQRIANAYNRQGTDIAQALQARKIFRLMTPVGRRMTLQQEVARINQQYANEGRSEIQVRLSDLTLKAAEMAETEEDFAKVQKAANKELAEQMPANWKDKLRTWRMLSMLANPRTHIRNIVGNWIFVPTVGIKNAIGAGLESKFIKNGERTKAIRYTEDAKAFAKKDVQAMKDTLTGEAKYSPESKLQQEQKAFGQGNGILSRTIGRGVQAIADANSWALEAEDWVFLNKHYQNAMASYMTANNLTSEQMTGKTLEKARAYAVQEAQKATYRDANAVSSLLNKASREGGIKGFLVDAILPFKKTPANILRRGIEYSPIGLIKSFATAKRSLDLYQSWVNNGMKGDAPKGAKSMTQVLDGIASGITGTGIAALGALGYMLGAVKLGFGGAPDDELEKENGSQEYSIELFGYSFTIDWAAPVCMPFFTGAALYKEFSEAAGDIKNLGDVTSVMGRVINGLGSISEPVFNLSMLDGVSSLLQSSSYSNTNSVPVFELLQNIGANYVGSFAPSFVGAVARTVDRTTRKSYVESGDPLRIWKQKMEQTQNKIPYLSMYNIPYRDVWGNTNESSVLEAVLENFILPGYVNKLKDDKKIDELWRIFDETGETSVIPKTAAKKVGGASLTDQEYDRYVVTRGQTANNLLNELVNRDEFITLTPTDVSEGNPEAQVKLISKVWEYANSVARKELDPNYKQDSWIAEAQKKGNVIDAIFNKEEAKAKSDAADQAFKEMFASINGNDADGITTSLEALRRAGKTNKQIRDKLMRQYGNVYKQAYLDGDIDTMDDIEDALMLLDLEESSFKSSTFKTWKKNANKKANEEEDEE